MKGLKYLLIGAMLFTLGACQRSQEERNRILKIYNWADYIDEDVLAEFPDWYKEQTGEEIEVKYVLDLRDFPGNPIQDKIVHDYADIDYDTIWDILQNDIPDEYAKVKEIVATLPPEPTQLPPNMADFL